MVRPHLACFLCKSALSHFESESVKKKQRGYEMCWVWYSHIQHFSFHVIHNILKKDTGLWGLQFSANPPSHLLLGWRAESWEKPHVYQTRSLKVEGLYADHPFSDPSGKHCVYVCIPVWPFMAKEAAYTFWDTIRLKGTCFQRQR